MYPGAMQMPAAPAASSMYGAYQTAAPTYPMPQQMMPVPVHQPPPSGPMPGNDDSKIFVGGLLPTTSSATLQAYFQQYGPVLEARVVLDRITGQSKRFAFVAFADPESAARAAAPGHHVIEGKQCNVNLVSQKDQAMEAFKNDPNNKRSREDGDDGGEHKRRRTTDHSAAGYSPYQAYGAYSGYPGYTAAMAPYAPGMPPIPPLPGRPGDPKIYVGNLAPTTSEEILTQVLSVFGDVAEAKVIRDQETNESKGFAFVTFVDPGAAARAASCGVLFIEGRRCTTNLASAKSKK